MPGSPRPLRPHRRIAVGKRRSDINGSDNVEHTHIGDVLLEATELFRTEGKLIRAEISDKFTQVQVGGGSLAAGAICVLVALVILVQALVIALAHLVGPAWSSLIVAVAAGLVGLVLINRGKKVLATVSLVPDRAIEQLQKDGHLVKEQVR